MVCHPVLQGVAVVAPFFFDVGVSVDHENRSSHRGKYSSSSIDAQLRGSQQAVPQTASTQVAGKAVNQGLETGAGSCYRGGQNQFQVSGGSMIRLVLIL